MKNVLIFTLSTGNGHNQAAASIKELLIQKEVNVTIIDPLDYSSRLVKKTITDGYLFIANHIPKLYGGLYQLSNYKRANVKSLSLFKKTLRPVLESHISINKPDLVISTHPLLNATLSLLKKHHSFSLVSVITDYRAHRSYAAQNIDAYITGSKDTANSLQAYGIEQKRIYPFGIPVSKKFFTQHSDSTKQVTNSFHVLVMGGSMGYGITPLHLKELLALGNHIHLHIVCGNNKKMYKELVTLMNDHKNSSVSLYGYTQEIPRLMDLCDVIVSKPGGLTIAESLIKNKPLIIPFYIPGQEEENVQFILRNQLGLQVKTPSELRTTIEFLSQNPHSLAFLKMNLSKQSYLYSYAANLDLLMTFIDKDSTKVS